MTDEPSAAEPLHRNVVKVIDAGRALGVDVVPRSYPQGAKTAQDAADSIGVDVGQIVKSLIFGVASDDPDGHLELVLAYVSGSNQLDEKKLAAAAGAKQCARVDADAVRSTTGFPIGGVPPFGHDTALRIFIDPDLLRYDEVWAAAGTWHDVFGIAPDRLAQASGGLVVDLRRD
jgi:prolyl-tRNA editing enzyme YbaK/EbsC (Cys-tRNA(Pro) deacylase)